MVKTLAESAAEILKASMAAAKKDPDEKSTEAQDLGGATIDNPGGNEIGKAAAAAVSKAPEPKAGGVKEEDETNTEDENDDEVVTLEDVINSLKGSMSEDIEALFSGESLSEEFKQKATTIFEAAVMSRVRAITEQVVAQNDAILEIATEEIKEQMVSKIDGFLAEETQTWITENKVAVESGIRAELVEGFINGMKNLFAEHYVEIPDEKVDISEELASQVAALDEENKASKAQIVELTKSLNEAKKNESIRKICEGLTEVQISKMKTLAEGVEFTTEGDYDAKLATIRENYFSNNKTVKSEIALTEDNSKEEDNKEVIDPAMARYVHAISKTLPR